MKQNLVNRYNILISSPSDMSSYSKIVREKIIEFNTSYGYDMNVFFEPKDWKYDTMPEYGKSGQQVINEQIVYDADAVITLFGAKFGTPTEKFESGTLEEIEFMHMKNREIMVYFSTGKSVNLNDIDTVQLEKVRNFKQKFNGLYAEFKSQKKFKERIIEDLRKLAKKLISKNSKDLKIYSYNGNDMLEHLIFAQYNITNSDFMLGIKEKIISNIKEINLLNCKDTTITNELIPSSSLIENISKLTDSIYPRSEIQFSNERKQLIYKFAEDNDINLSSDFFQIGNAHYRTNMINLTVCGNKEETTKVNLIFSCINDIKKYNAYVEFFNQFDQKFFLTLVLKNESGIFAEDISIKLKIEKNCFDDIKKYNISNKLIADSIKDFLGDFEYFNTTEINRMEYPMVMYPQYIVNKDIFSDNNEPDLDYCNQYFDVDKEKLYPYIINTNEEYTILKFNLTKGLKQFDSQFISAQLMFSNIPNKIDYLITSRSFNYEISGTLYHKNKS